MATYKDKPKPIIIKPEPLGPRCVLRTSQPASTCFTSVRPISLATFHPIVQMPLAVSWLSNSEMRVS